MSRSQPDPDPTNQPAPPSERRSTTPPGRPTAAPRNPQSAAQFAPAFDAQSAGQPEPPPDTQYVSALASRNASPAMQEIFSARRKFVTWRKLWLALAQAEHELGLDITQAQLDALAKHLEDIDYDNARAYERRLRHDVMAHVHAFGDAAPQARGIIHLGATSQFVVDNTELIQLREALRMVGGKLGSAIDKLGAFAGQYRDLPTLGFTHFQPAQPTTVGKRACVWAQDLMLGIEEIEHQLQTLRFRGVKGTTGTQASFLALFNRLEQSRLGPTASSPHPREQAAAPSTDRAGDCTANTTARADPAASPNPANATSSAEAKVEQLDRLVCMKMGWDPDQRFTVTGQTYPRLVDARVHSALSTVAAGCAKLATDLRLLCHRKEVDEPSERDQIGSSAMAYKRNPMRCERICALSRFIIGQTTTPFTTAAEQWLERTLDDSACRRLTLPEPFLALDAVLDLVNNVVSGLVVYPKSVEANLERELPFMATENLLMAAVSLGGDRQDLHERIRQHSLAAGQQIKAEGGENDLIERLKQDEAFAGVDFEAELDPSKFIGRAPAQVERFIAEQVEPIRQRYASQLGYQAALCV